MSRIGLNGMGTDRIAFSAGGGFGGGGRIIAGETQDDVIDDDIFSEDGDGLDNDEAGLENELNSGLDGNDDITLEDEFDPVSLISAIAGEQDPDETPEQRTQRLRDSEKALGTQIQSSIDAMALAEDLIPEDFDPNDRAQMHNLLTNTIRGVMPSILSVMFKPVQQAFEHNNQALRSHIQESLSGNNSDNSFNQQLSRQIPALNDPARAPIIKQLAASARTRFPNEPKKAIRAVQQAMQAAGISSTFNKPGNSGRQGSGGGLDAFFGAPKPERQPAKTRNGLRR